MATQKEGSDPDRLAAVAEANQNPDDEKLIEPPRKRRRLSARLNAENTINGIAPLTLGSISSDREPLRPKNPVPMPVNKAKAHKKNPWKAEEDNLLFKLKGDGLAYSEISLRIPGRSSKQCRERWTSALNPQLNRADFSEAEDQLICEVVAKEGPRWAKLEKEFDSKRAANTIKNRFNNRLRDSQMYQAALRRLGPQPAVVEGGEERPEGPPEPKLEPPVSRATPIAQAAAVKREQESEQFMHTLVSSAERSDDNRRFLVALQNLMNRFPNLFNPAIDPLALSVDELMRRQQDRGLFHHHLRRLVDEFKPTLEIPATPTQLTIANALQPPEPYKEEKSHGNVSGQGPEAAPAPQEASGPQLYSTEELPPMLTNEIAHFASPIPKPPGRKIHLRLLPRASSAPAENESDAQFPPEPFGESPEPIAPPPPRARLHHVTSRIPAGERENVARSTPAQERVVKRLPAKTMARTPRPLIGKPPELAATSLAHLPYPEIPKKQPTNRAPRSPQSDSLASVSSRSSPDQTPEPSRSNSIASAPSSVSSTAALPGLSLGSMSIGSTPGNSSGSGGFLSPGAIRSKRRRSSVGSANAAALPFPSPIASSALHQSPLPSPSASFHALDAFQLNDFNDDFVGALEFDTSAFDDHSSLFTQPQSTTPFTILPSADSHMLPQLSHRPDVEQELSASHTNEGPRFPWEGEDGLMQEHETDFPYTFGQPESDS